MSTLGHIGDASHATGRLDDARAAWQDALAILDELRHPDAALIQAKLAELPPDGAGRLSPMTSALRG